MTLFDELKKIIVTEHACINSVFENLNSLKDLPSSLIWLQKNAIDNHHRNEELFIFSQIYKHKKLHEGGPYCSLYFDSFCQNRPSDIIHSLTHSHLKYVDSQSKLLLDRTPLEIPLEEHAAIENGLDYLSENIENIISLQSFLTELHIISKKHHEKEEQCFLQICKNLLSDQELKLILDQWIPLQKF